MPSMIPSSRPAMGNEYGQRDEGTRLALFIGTRHRPNAHANRQGGLGFDIDYKAPMLTERISRSRGTLVGAATFRFITKSPY